MPTQISITGVTGTPPYSVTVCDSTYTYCYLVTGSTTIPPTFIFEPPSPLDVASSLIIKIVDSNGCEYFEPYSCPPTPTPTPTITPTPTPTPTNLCYCISSENTGSTIGSFNYIDCNGNFLEGIPVPVGITYYCCGSNPTLPDQVSITVGDLCVDNSCVPLPPVASLTPTPTSTITPTPTPSLSCNPLNTHPFQLTFSTSTTLYGNHTTNLTTACDAAACLNSSTCVSNASVLPYLNSTSFVVGDYLYSNSTGCNEAPVTGYFISQILGVWTVVEVVSGQIVSFPC